MKEKSIITLIAIMCFLSSVAQDTESFNKLLSENQLVFEKPEGFTECEVVKNPNLFYNYAMKHNQDSFEVRYSIVPLDSINNRVGDAMFIATLVNVSQAKVENLPKNGAIPPKDVKTQYGADSARVTAIFEANSTFAKDYKYCMMVFLHKENAANVYMSYLSNDNNHENYKKNLIKVLPALRFKQGVIGYK
ncbi:hypothetical protein QVZ41_09115 [Wenyingzhuangia sp. chi5]|uniref:Uncharacterized protein n=1 Tax=Wenyingzhuangia gilva TaxID=3057677 RepID=A0ABT8VSQ5_9FLAO|nr:hypothetical protein [Wenyingzhuangia sp. chi5]MDO3695000.1 hypothetical protein [Wenyingzhuangia sp. chi5]